ncbi:alpha/beta hydrolase fold-1 [Tanacetum coccineum]
MHIWCAKNRVYKKANLVLIHGFGGNSKWQFLLQIRQLAGDFNVYVPDLVFFGESYSSKSDRSVGFQAKCVCDGLKKMRVDKFSVYAISYGGFVGYRMAEVYDDMVEKLVIVSSGIVCKHERKLEHVQKIGLSVVDLLVAKTPEDLRMLCRISIHKYDIGRWIPDFFLWGFIGVSV